MKKRVTIAGSILVDVVKTVETYPEKGMLSSILNMQRAVGGCVPNTAIDLKKIDPSLSVKVLGRVGNDDYGNYVTNEMQRVGINVSGIVRSDTPTSFSDVITVKSTGERTFFHCRGANADFTEEDIDVDALDCDLFHIGYVMLLGKLEREDSEYGTHLARLLKRVRERGIKTSIDCVSETDGAYREKVMPVLRYCSYAVLNEIEGSGVSGIPARNADGTLNDKNILQIMKYFVSCGVSEKVIIHAPEASYSLDKSGYAFKVPSLQLPKGFIKGSVGAGDAFCAGSLYGFLYGMTDEEILRFASSAAASSLSREDSVSGMGNQVEILALDSCMKRDKGERLC